MLHLLTPEPVGACEIPYITRKGHQHGEEFARGMLKTDVILKDVITAT
jgi:hypothetical protein